MLRFSLVLNFLFAMLMVFCCFYEMSLSSDTGRVIPFLPQNFFALGGH